MWKAELGDVLTSSAIAGGHAKCSFEVCGYEFTGRLPQLCDFSPATFPGSGAGVERSARAVVIPGERSRGSQEPGNSARRDKINTMMLTW